MELLTKEKLDNPENYCLLLTMDDHNSINNQRLNQTKEFTSRDYMAETKGCIKAWRKNGGRLKDIDIIIDYVGKSELSNEYKTFFKDYNCKVLYSDYSKQTEKFDYGFINVHLTGYYLQMYYPELLKKVIIHIDLDMELLQPIPTEFFEPLITKDCIIGGYRNEDLVYQRLPLYANTILNSDLVITKSLEYSKINVYKEFIDNINYVNDNYEIITKEIIENNPNQKIRTFDIEEYGVDRTYSFHPEKFQIIKEDSYEQGEGYYKIKNIDIKKVYFWHQHLTNVKTNLELFEHKIKLKKMIKDVSSKN